MEKAIKHHEPQERADRKDDGFPDEHHDENMHSESRDHSRPVKRKRERIRAYRRIDYWE